MKYYLLLSLCLLPLYSCSRSAPRIPYGALELVYYQAQGALNVEERFSFFIIAEDDDGIENLETLSLYHDLDGLHWDLSFEDWVRLDDQGKTWIGSRAITMPDNAPLPRGQYRAVLTNKGGERTSRFLAFDEPDAPRHRFPVFSISEGNYSITSTYPEHFFICYDSTGQVVKTTPVENMGATVASLGLASNIRALALWAQDAEYHSSALTDLIPIR
jgi:hypothetical protein